MGYSCNIPWLLCLLCRVGDLSRLYLSCWNMVPSCSCKPLVRLNSFHILVLFYFAGHTNVLCVKCSHLEKGCCNNGLQRSIVRRSLSWYQPEAASPLGFPAQLTGSGTPVQNVLVALAEELPLGSLGLAEAQWSLCLRCTQAFACGDGLPLLILLCHFGKWSLWKAFGCPFNIAVCPACRCSLLQVRSAVVPGKGTIEEETIVCCRK